MRKKLIILTFALISIFSGAVEAAITVDSAETVAHRSTTSPLTWTFTNTAGNLLVVGVTTAANSGTATLSLASVSYNGVLMTKFGTGQLSLNGGVLTQLFFLVNPATGAHPVSAVWTNNGPNKSALGGAISFAGADIISPFGATEFKAAGNGPTADSGAVTSAVGSMVVSVASTGGAFGTLVAPDTRRFFLNNSGNTAGDNIAGTTWLSTGLSHHVVWNLNSDLWVIVAAEVHAASGIITPPPSLTSLSPVTGAVGSTVILTGLNFGATPGTSIVQFNGVTATSTSWSATSIAVTVPVGAVTGNVVVTVGGIVSNGILFTVPAAIVPPTLTSITPGSGVIGTVVTLVGTNFGATQGNSIVQFNGAIATPVSWNPTTIVVPVPVVAISGPVIVIVGGNASNAFTFTVTVATGPTLTSLTPSVGASGAQILITGTNLQTPSAVSFNGTAAAPGAQTTSIVTVVPAGATTGMLTVVVGGVTSNGLLFTVPAAPPTITLLAPASGVVGSSVVISGTNFGATQGLSTIQFNGALATVTGWSNSSITANVPSVTTGPVVVTVGGVASNGLSFTVTVSTTSATASWSANPETDITGYTLLYGTQTGVHPSAISLGNVTTTTVPGLTIGTTYYFVLTATDTSGLTSPLSAEVAYTP